MRKSLISSGSFRIVDGPDRFELMLGLFDLNSCSRMELAGLSFTFVDEKGKYQDVPIVVVAVERGDRGKYRSARSRGARGSRVYGVIRYLLPRIETLRES